MPSTPARPSVASERIGKPRSIAGAEALWHSHVSRLHADPCDAHLQSLVTLLDVMDGEIARRWGTDGHAERVALLASYRRVARHCNSLVSDAVALARAEAGRANAAKRKAAAA